MARNVKKASAVRGRNGSELRSTATRGRARGSASPRPQSNRRELLPKLSKVLKDTSADFAASARTLQALVGDNEGGYYESTYLQAAAAFQLAIDLDDADKWDRFREDDFWSDRTKKLKKGDRYRLAFIYMYGDQKGSKAQRARDHARALSGCWMDDWPPDEAYDFLTQVGFDGLKAAAKQEKKTAKVPSGLRLSLFVKHDRVGNDGRTTIIVERVKASDGKLTFKTIAVEPGDMRPSSLHDSDFDEPGKVIAMASRGRNAANARAR